MLIAGRVMEDLDEPDNFALLRLIVALFRNLVMIPGPLYLTLFHLRLIVTKILLRLRRLLAINRICRIA